MRNRDRKKQAIQSVALFQVKKIGTAFLRSRRGRLFPKKTKACGPPHREAAHVRHFRLQRRQYGSTERPNTRGRKSIGAAGWQKKEPLTLRVLMPLFGRMPRRVRLCLRRRGCFVCSDLAGIERVQPPYKIRACLRTVRAIRYPLAAVQKEAAAPKRPL